MQSNILSELNLTKKQFILVSIIFSENIESNNFERFVEVINSIGHGIL